MGQKQKQTKTLKSLKTGGSVGSLTGGLCDNLFLQ